MCILGMFLLLHLQTARHKFSAVMESLLLLVPLSVCLRGMDTLKVLRAWSKCPPFRRRWQTTPFAGELWAGSSWRWGCLAVLRWSGCAPYLMARDD